MTVEATRSNRVGRAILELRWSTHGAPDPPATIFSFNF
jgi:hypothetical protein